MPDDTVRRCAAARRDGTPCFLPAVSSGAYCFAHSPDLAAARARGGAHSSTAARASKHLPPHLRRMETRLLDLVREVSEGKQPPAVAQAIVASVGRLLDLAEFSVETAAASAIEDRLAALERQAAADRRTA